MIDQVDALKARKITSLMVAYLFENKKQIADGRKKKKKQSLLSYAQSCAKIKHDAIVRRTNTILEKARLPTSLTSL